MWDPTEIKFTELIYNDTNTTTIKNVILIDDSVKNYNLFVNSCNTETFPIVYSQSSDKGALLHLLKSKFTNSITRLCIVFSFNENVMFLNNESFQDSSATSFMINLIQEFNIKNIDFLACNTVLYSKWTQYYSLLFKQTGVIVGASDDKTGNLKHGGDWIMESSNVNVENIYFISKIKSYTYLLDEPPNFTPFIATWGNETFLNSNSAVYATFELDLANMPNPTAVFFNVIKPSWLKKFVFYIKVNNITSKFTNLHGINFDTNGITVDYTKELVGQNGLWAPPTGFGFDVFQSDSANFQAVQPNILFISSLQINVELTSFKQYTYPCFKENTKILTNKGYIPIQNLRKGDLVKTLKHDYVPINMIGKRDIHHQNEYKNKDQLYKCTKQNYSEIFEDLIITGCHSILVDSFSSKEQRENTIKINGAAYRTDNKYRLPACCDDRALIYDVAGDFTIYHLALDNTDYYMNYGIYANGLLVETCSKRYLKELSNMELIH